MQYDEVIKLITPQFLKWCCELSHNFLYTEISKNWIVIKNKANNDNLISYMISDEIYKSHEIINFQSLIFQAWIGCTYSDKFSIQLNIDSIIVVNEFNFEELFFYKDFKHGMSLLPEIQALVAALHYAMELEAEKC